MQYHFFGDLEEMVRSFAEDHTNDNVVDFFDEDYHYREVYLV